MHIFNSPDHQYACALENSRMMQVSCFSHLLNPPKYLLACWIDPYVLEVLR